jgi:hypothetical protein
MPATARAEAGVPDADAPPPFTAVELHRDGATEWWDRVLADGTYIWYRPKRARPNYATGVEDYGHVEDGRGRASRAEMARLLDAVAMTRIPPDTENDAQRLMRMDRCDDIVRVERVGGTERVVVPCSPPGNPRPGAAIRDAVLAIRTRTIDQRTRALLPELDPQVARKRQLPCTPVTLQGRVVVVGGRVLIAPQGEGARQLAVVGDSIVSVLRPLAGVVVELYGTSDGDSFGAGEVLARVRRKTVARASPSPHARVLKTLDAGAELRVVGGERLGHSNAWVKLFLDGDAWLPVADVSFAARPQAE